MDKSDLLQLIESKEFDSVLVAIIAGLVYTGVNPDLDVEEAVEFSVETAVKIASKAADLFGCELDLTTDE